MQEIVNELALFAGAGGGILGGHLLGWRTVCAVELDGYARDVLVARQNDGTLPPFPIWDDIQTFDGRPWRGCVDVVSGGFPCQDISCAGKGAGIDGERSGLWGEMARVVREVGPRYVLVENSPMLTSRGLGRVLGDLAAMGYDARWGVLGAVHAGAPHRRERIWIVADALSSWERGEPRQAEVEGDAVADSHAARLEERCGERRNIGPELPPTERGGKTLLNPNRSGCEHSQESNAGETVKGFGKRVSRTLTGSGWWDVEPDVGRVADELADWLDESGTIAEE